MLSRRKGVGCYCGSRARAKREEGWKLARTDEVSRFMSACELIATMRSSACSAGGASSPGCNEAAGGWRRGASDQTNRQRNQRTITGQEQLPHGVPSQERKGPCCASALQSFSVLLTSVNQSARCNQPNAEVVSFNVLQTSDTQ